MKTKSNIIRLLLATMLTLLVWPVVHAADSPEAVRAEINRIKLDGSYFYGQGRTEDKAMAYGNALDDLLISINEERSTAGKPQLKRRDIENVLSELVTTDNRGRHLCFLYIARDKALAITPKAAPAVDIPGGHQARKPAPKAEQKPAPKAEPKRQPAVSQNDDMLAIFCAMNTWTELKPLITEYKNLGRITEAKPTMNPAEVPADAYAILFDPDGGVLAILSPADSGRRIDCRTGREDNESNHSNLKFILWYK